MLRYSIYCGKCTTCNAYPILHTVLSTIYMHIDYSRGSRKIQFFHKTEKLASTI